MNITDTNDKNLLPAAVVLAGALVAGAIILTGARPLAGPEQAAVIGALPSGAPSVNVKDVKIAGAPFIGLENAQVTMVAWGDLQCPFCKKFETETLPLIVRDYVEKGKVKIVFLDLPLTQIHPNALTMALYSRAIWKLYPEQYLKWREAILKRQGQDFGNAASVDALNATIVGLDATRIKADVQANTSVYQARIDADMAEAQRFDIGATPSFIVGTQKISGAYPYETFEEAIEDALKK